MTLTKNQIIEALKTVTDPEVGLDIWTMGLIYNLEIQGDMVKILMTYTTPFCPWGPQLNEAITNALQDRLGVSKVEIKITFDPPYKIPDELRAMLGV
ncbi:MAG: metal-sulfur cluster assembly factor [Candidatus Magasanikbacteria bacterium]|nr:metal-sulfur cluster assembly factor [Candidatus Magasanikbacteria bacterium]